MRPGLTVVVSPLIALMKDQVDSAVATGIPAAFLNSTQDASAARGVWREVYSRETRLLYVSPERLALQEFRDRLAELEVQYFAVDEAHCISEWGHEFRRDYRTLDGLRTAFPGVPIAAFTATATPQVQDDVIAHLGLRNPLVIRGDFDRRELFYHVRHKTDLPGQLLEWVRNHRDAPGIIYRTTRKDCEATADHLRRHGVAAVPYHAGMDEGERAKNQELFVHDGVQVVVATIAFGMGIDKSNIRWIVHGDLPRSVEGYYQETGRAGRDGADAEVLLLWSGGDIATQRWFIGQTEDPVQRDTAERQLRDVIRYAEAGSCRRTILLAHFDQLHGGSCHRCDVCAGLVQQTDQTIAAQKFLSAAARTGERFGTHHLVDILLGVSTDRVVRFRHDQLPTFGVGSSLSRGRWLDVAGQLESAGHLRRAPRSDGGGLSMTDTGREILYGTRTFSMVEAPRKTPRAASRESREPLREDQEQLFQVLREVRRTVARTQGIPPYRVFSDRTLQVMARNRPLDAAAFLRCHGVGERKGELYGGQFIAAIRQFLYRDTPV